MLLQLVSKIRTIFPDLTGVGVVSLSVIAVMGGVLGIRYLGGLQRLELVAYDQLVRLQPDAPLDERLLIVEITEEDIRQQQQWPLSDEAIAQALEKLQSLDPKVIGLDIYRDIPIEPGHSQLVQQYLPSNLIAIRNIDSLMGTPAPKAIAPDQVGFNDLPLDPDNVIRRNILLAEWEGNFLYSLSLRLALVYLQDQGITPENSERNPAYLQLGKAVFIPLEPHSGAYQHIDVGGYQVLLNYRTRENIARTVTLTEVLTGSINPNWVKDKIVLIGTTAPSLNDTFFTPYSPDLKSNYKMPGVMVHAQMVSQLLDGATGERPLIWFWSDTQERWWIVVWIMAGAIIGWGFRHPLAVSLGMGMGILVLFGMATLVFIEGGWIPIAAPMLGFLLTMGMVVTYQSYQDHQQHQIVMKLLGQNTSPQIANELWRRRDRLLKSGKLPGTQLTATMMFVDIKDFSTIAEEMPPRDLMDWVNELLEIMTAEVLSHHGIVNKFTGDGMMAVFGVPTAHLDHREVAEDAQQAVNCALVIGDRLSQMNRNWCDRGLPVIQLRIGIFTGPVVVGSLGGKDRLEYGVLGDSVNIAARLEACEKHRQPNDCRILIAKETLVYLDNQFEVESWGPLALKGKQQMIEVYWVIQRKEPHSLSSITQPNDKQKKYG